jgi:hypothetical protein
MRSASELQVGQPRQREVAEADGQLHRAQVHRALLREVHVGQRPRHVDHDAHLPVQRKGQRQHHADVSQLRHAAAGLQLHVVQAQHADMHRPDADLADLHLLHAGLADARGRNRHLHGVLPPAGSAASRSTSPQQPPSAS